MGQKRFPPLHARKVRRITKEKTTRNLEGIGDVIVFIKCIPYFVFVNVKDTCTFWFFPTPPFKLKILFSWSWKLDIISQYFLALKGKEKMAWWSTIPSISLEGTSKNRPFPWWPRQPRAPSLRRAQTWCSSHRAPSCIRPYTPVFRARLPCPHKKCLVFRGAHNTFNAKRNRFFAEF